MTDFDKEDESFVKTIVLCIGMNNSFIIFVEEEPKSIVWVSDRFRDDDVSKKEVFNREYTCCFAKQEQNQIFLMILSFIRSNILTYNRSLIISS